MEKRITARDLFDAVYGLRTFLVGYDDALIQAALALLTRNHMFLVGHTGQGKSTFLSLLSELFDGAAIFRPQLSAFTIPDHLIGPPIPSLYRREGKQIYYVDGGICDAQLALMEEWPDAGVALARALNTILLERQFVTKDKIYECRLHSAIMTGNHIPQGEQWEAVKARELFFFHAPLLRNIAGRFCAMETADLRRNGKYPFAGVPFEEVQHLADEVQQVRLSPGVMLVLAWCLSRFEERCSAKALPTHLMNTRSQNNLLPVLKAIALIKGFRDVQYEHIKSLHHVLPGGHDVEYVEARRVWDEVVAVAVPDQKHLQQFKLYDQLGALMDQVNRLRLSPHTTREIVFELPYTAIKLFGETGFHDWIANCKGLTTLSELVDEVRRSGIRMLPRQESSLENGSSPVTQTVARPDPPSPPPNDGVNESLSELSPDSRSGPPVNVFHRATRQILDSLARVGSFLGELWRFASAILSAFFPVLQRQKKLKPWMIVRRGKSKPGTRELIADEKEVRRLLERMKQLNDAGRLTERAAAFNGSGDDFFAKPQDVEQIVESLVRQNPPFLHIARELPSEDQGENQQVETEYIDREMDIVVTEPWLLFIPQTGVEYLEHTRPPGYPMLRTARSLADLRCAPLLYQAMPYDYTVSRLVEGAIPILAYREERHYLLFRPEERLVTHRERRMNHVPVEIERGAEGNSTRLMYMLFDRSTSLVRNCKPRGLNAVMELSIAVAMVRADLGRPHARYYYRNFAERLFPLAKDPPIVATSVTEKDALVDRLFNTNFSGEATNVVEALESAADDIEHVMQTAGEKIAPRICLLTDGRATIYRNVGVRLKRLGIELDTILIGKEAAHNPELMRISTTVSLVDPELYASESVAA